MLMEVVDLCKLITVMYAALFCSHSSNILMKNSNKNQRSKYHRVCYEILLSKTPPIASE